MGTDFFLLLFCTTQPETKFSFHPKQSSRFIRNKVLVSSECFQTLPWVPSGLRPAPESPRGSPTDARMGESMPVLLTITGMCTLGALRALAGLGVQNVVTLGDIGQRQKKKKNAKITRHT
jgi:hypothetical protein